MVFLRTTGSSASDTSSGEGFNISWHILMEPKNEAVSDVTGGSVIRTVVNESSHNGISEDVDGFSKEWLVGKGTWVSPEPVHPLGRNGTTVFKIFGGSSGTILPNNVGKVHVVREVTVGSHSVESSKVVVVVFDVVIFVGSIKRDGPWDNIVESVGVSETIIIAENIFTRDITGQTSISKILVGSAGLFVVEAIFR